MFLLTQVCPSFTTVTCDPFVASIKASESWERESSPPGPSSLLPDSNPSQQAGASLSKSCTSCQDHGEPTDLLPRSCSSQQEALQLLQRSGLVRRRAQQMETLAGLTGPARLEQGGREAKMVSLDLHSQDLSSQDIRFACCSSSSASSSDAPSLMLLLRPLSPQEEMSSLEVGAPPSEPRS